MCVAMSRSPRPNQSGPAPYAASSPSTAWLSPARPQPCSSLIPPPRVYMTVSRSGQTCRPNGVKSSPVLPITVTSASGTVARRPRRNLAAPTPPARTVMRMHRVLQLRRPGCPLPRGFRPGCPRAGDGEWPLRAAFQKLSCGLSPHPGQPGGHYHVSPLTSSKTRACNFTHVILAPTQAGAGAARGTDAGRCAVADVIVSLVHDALGIGADDAAEQSWQDRALCAQTDPEAFFPEKGGSTREAKRVCRSCEVRAECLEYALGNDERFGIWGGLSERERRRLKRQAV